MHYEKHYSPRLMSLGPIHHGAPKLQLGEQFKQMWAAMYIRSTGQAPQSLHGRVLDNMEEVMKLFATDLFTTFSNFSDQGFGSMKEMICWTLFVDACALLQILENAELGEAYKMNVKVEQLNLVVQDVILLENQLPFPLLKLLWRDTDESSLIPIMKKFLRYYWDARTEEWEIMRIEPPTHLLDLLRSIMLPESRHPDNRDSIIYFHSKFLGKMLIHRYGPSHFKLFLKLSMRPKQVLIPLVEV
uniref:UPF0481 protein At3g47200 family n=1 Tax=Cajanus cajan TaxID=3821 RepID=A0A151S2A0_CAJCA|nr:UPF0481 protein At3g47200 family [Cajanus cajan]